jgi:protoporphyrinogen oxidase
VGELVAVIGAGPAGLAAAGKLVEGGREVVLLEAGDQPGGLSGTLRVDGYGFDYGGHRLITRNPRVVSLAQELLGDELLCTQRVSKILFQRKFWSQPLEMANAMRSVRPGMAALAVSGYLAAGSRRMAGRAHQDRSFEDWVVARFGRPLYELFFGPYTRKVWGVDPSVLAAAWAPRRIMVSGLAGFAKALLVSEHRRPATTTKRYLYPRRGAGQLYEALADRAERAGVEFRYHHRAETVDLSGGRVRVTARNGQSRAELEVDAVVSTAPLPDLVRAVRPAPPAEVLEAAGALRYRGIVFVFVRLDREVALGWDALYVPEPEYLFFRVEEPRYWSPMLVPENKSSLCFEIAASPGDAVWTATDQELVDACLRDFARMGFAIPAREVAGFDVARRAHVYPMQLVDTEPARATCLGWLATLRPRLQSVGRQGAFKYLDMDESLETGWRAADVLADQETDTEIVQEAAYLWDAGRQVAGVRRHG